MADRVTKKQRSKMMAAVKSNGNASTELALIRIFRKQKVTGGSDYIREVTNKIEPLFYDLLIEYIKNKKYLKNSYRDYDN